MIRESEGKVIDGRNVFKKAREASAVVPSYNKTDTEAMQLRFGASEAVKDPTTGDIKEPAKDDAKGVYETGKQEIDKITGVLDYVDIDSRCDSYL